MNELLRTLPRVDDVLDCITEKLPRELLLDCIRDILDNCRNEILKGEYENISLFSKQISCEQKIVEQAIALAKSKTTPSLRPVINATGIVLHTNLGRALLSEAVAEHVKQVAMGYSSLEYNLQTGKRGSRTVGVEKLLTKLTNAEAACIVNNNAAGVLLALSALCAGRKVIVSRGEMVEIGGSFRVPEVISQGGAILHEVGATNKTRLSDYEHTISVGSNLLPTEMPAILKVHTSNYKIMGFTEDVNLKELATLAKKTNIPLIYDLGSGSLVSIAGEPTVQEAIADGVDILCFSGDKLLGGPQCGIIVGSAKYIAKILKHPLYRALRADKLSLAALEASLALYLDMDDAKTQIPTLAMLLASSGELKEKATHLLELLDQKNIKASLQKVSSQAGGGSLPLQEFESWAVAVTQVENLTLDELEKYLRGWRIPIIARIHKDALLLDARTINECDFMEIAECLKSIISEIQNSRESFK